MPDTMKVEKFYQISEVDEKTHVVYGIATAEVVDCDNEICDYADTVPLYKVWSKSSSDSTTAAGQEVSLGNVRLQHTSQIAGKVTKIDYDDDSKQIRIATEPLDDNIWVMVKRGFVTGFSQGGKYTYRNCSKCGTSCGEPGKYDCPSCKMKVVVRYAIKPSEVSYVDRPCLGVANFTFVKGDGAKEVRKFHPGHLTKSLDVIKAKTKRVADEDLPSSAFAYVGDVSDTSTWKLPIKFKSETKTKTHIRNALARFGQTKGIPDGDRGKVKAKIVSAARSHGIAVAGVNKLEGGTPIVKIDVSELATKLASTGQPAGVEKGMYQVQSLAGILRDLQYLEQSCRSEGAYEEDERDIVLADEVVEAMRLLVGTLKGLVEEEGSELLATKMAASEGETMNVNDVLKAASKSLVGFLRKAATHHEKAAEHHKSIADEHAAAHETCKEAMESCSDDGMKCMAKGMAAHHKSMAQQHEKLHKSHSAQMDSCTKMAQAEEDAGAKIDVPEVIKVEKTEAAKAAPAAAATTDAAAATPAVADIPGDIQKTVNTMLGDAIEKAVKESLSNINDNDAIKTMVADTVRARVSEALGNEKVPSKAKVGGPELVLRNGVQKSAPAAVDDSCGL